jgi:hypothetical protein
MNYSIHSLQYCLSLCLSICMCICMYILYCLKCSVLSSQTSPLAHRFCIEIYLFSASGIILRNRKLLNSSTCQFCWHRASLFKLRSRVKNLNLLPRPFILESGPLLEKPPAFSGSIGDIFLKIQTHHPTDICHTICK